MISDFVKPQGNLLFIKNGDIVMRVDNLVVNAGLAAITNRLLTASAIPTHMGVGTGSTAPAAANTALQTQLSRIALASAPIRVTTDVANDSVQFTATFAAGVATGAWQEAGLFDAASGGNMWTRSTFAVVNKGAADSMSIVWTLKFGA